MAAAAASMTTMAHRELFKSKLAGSLVPHQIPEGRLPHVQCSVAKMRPLVSTTSSSGTSIREARIEDFWQVADTHCGVFMPDQGLLMDLALRFDRVMALLGSLPFSSGSLHKTCLVAVEEDDFRLLDSEGDGFRGVLATLVPSSQVSGVLTIDNIAEFLPRRKPSGRRRTGIAYVSNVAVRHDRRRRGLARKLLRASEALAKCWGCRSVALHCAAENTSAVDLYIGEGYKVVKLAMRANWPRPMGLPGSSYLFLMKRLASSC